jgi:peptidoglycan/LPS O-acetylase OafA/YrhL
VTVEQDDVAAAAPSRSRHPVTPDGPSPASSSDSRHRFDIDGLRAVAVTLVVLYHAGVPWIPGGFVGVDVFFVISGFLITGLLLGEARRTGRVSIPHFYARRVRRLLPASAVVLVTTVVVWHLIVAPLAAERVDKDATAAALYVANWSFAAQTSDYFAAQVDASPLLHYWSLGVEEQFYVVWPLLIIAALGLGAARLRGSATLDTSAGRRVALALALVGGTSFAWSVLATASQPGWSYYGLHTRAWELAVGAGLALALPWVATWRRGAAVAVGWLGLLLILVAALRYDSGTVFPGAAAAVPVLGTAMVLAAGARERRGGAPRLISNRAMVRIGLVSYSWYLWHWPALTFARALTGDVGPEGDVGPAPAWAIVGAVAVSYLLAELSVRLIENPVRLSTRLSGRTGTTLLVGLALTAIPVVVTLLPLPGPLSWAVSSPAGDPEGGETLVVDGPPTPGSSSTSTPAADALAEARAALAAVPDVRPAVSPQEAKDDLVRGMGECHQSFAAAPLAQACAFGDTTSATTVVLVGDSKAQHWFPALEAAATKNHWRLLAWTKSSCPMADVSVTNDRVKGRYTACETWRDDVTARIATIAGGPGVDLVLVGRSRGYAGSILDADGAPVADPSAAWAAGMTRTVDAMGDVTTVALLRDLPWASSDRPECLSAHLDESSECAFLATVSASEKTLAAGESVVDAAQDDVVSLDLTALVCPESVCRAVADDGTVVFRDAHHMTATFSTSMAAPLATRLLPLLAG